MVDHGTQSVLPDTAQGRGSTSPQPPLLRRSTVAAAVTVFVMAALSAPPAHLFAEVRSSVSIDLYNTLIFGGGPGTGGDPASAGFAEAELDLESVGNRDVRSRFQLRTFLLEDQTGGATATLTVPRAEVRWRMYIGEDYTMRFTAGRTRLSWGDGRLYNAGDVINGARPGGQVTLTDEVLRDETLWLLSAYLPMGRFAFVEPVILFPMVRVPSLGSTQVAPAADQTGVGGRVHGKIGGIKTEGGYLYRGDEDVHQPYVSLQGNLWVDWYVAATRTQPTSGSGDNAVSGGLLYNGEHQRWGGWSARVEGLWTDEDDTVHAYPELTWSPSQLFSLFLRGQLSFAHADTTTDTGAGIRWTPATGLTLSLLGTADVDAEEVIMTASVNFVF